MSRLLEDDAVGGDDPDGSADDADEDAGGI